MNFQSAVKRAIFKQFQRQPYRRWMSADTKQAFENGSGGAKQQKQKPQNEQTKQESTFGKLWSSSSIVSDVIGAFKDTKRVIIDENASRYGGMTSKAYRDEIKRNRLKGFKSAEDQAASVSEDPEAGSNIVLHKDSKWKEAWSSFKETNPLVQGVFTMRRKYEESDNAFVNTARLFSERIREMLGPVFEESEHAQTLAEIKTVDPEFDLETFLKDSREFMIPELLEAFVYWDPKTLKEWCSDAVFSVLSASRDPLIEQGLDIEGRILDLRNVDLVMAKIMDGVPLLIMSFKTQQIEVVRNMEGEIVGGSPDKINDVYYILALTKDAEKLNPLTKGWKIVEFAIQGVRESY